MLATAAAGPIIVIGAVSTDPGALERADVLRAAGAQVELIPAQASEKFLVGAMSRLVECGVSSIVLEGGPRLHAAMWKANLVDRVQMFKTGAAAGAEGVRWLDPASFSAAVLEDVSTLRLGDDELMQGYVHRAR
jgi:diaminohydroxyphosphoribosylaminopyrimidine deaminase/5-amino-6-(5-phosphoribosylamino)uracil reductase